MNLDEVPTKELVDELSSRAELIRSGLCTYCGRRVKDTEPCRFEDRHVQDMSLTSKAIYENSKPGFYEDPVDLFTRFIDDYALNREFEAWLAK